jgi:hypothetical protein
MVWAGNGYRVEPKRNLQRTTGLPGSWFKLSVDSPTRSHYVPVDKCGKPRSPRHATCAGMHGPHPMLVASRGPPKNRSTAPLLCELLETWPRGLVGGFAMQKGTGRADVCRVALDFCRAALARGPLVREGNGWRYGRRRFSNETVKRLIDAGIACRDGPVVRSTESLQKA